MVWRRPSVEPRAPLSVIGAHPPASWRGRQGAGAAARRHVQQPQPGSLQLRTAASRCREQPGASDGRQCSVAAPSLSLRDRQTAVQLATIAANTADTVAGAGQSGWRAALASLSVLSQRTCLSAACAVRGEPCEGPRCTVSPWRDGRSPACKPDAVADGPCPPAPRRRISPSSSRR